MGKKQVSLLELTLFLGPAGSCLGPEMPGAAGGGSAFPPVQCMPRVLVIFPVVKFLLLSYSRVINILLGHHGKSSHCSGLGARSQEHI